MRIVRLAPVLAAVMSVAACKTLDVEDFNASALQDLLSNPTPASIATASTGLLTDSRGLQPIPQFAFTAIAGELGREGYSLDPSNPNITVARLQALDQSTGSANLWQAAYRTIKQAEILIRAVDGVTSFTAAQKSAVKGFAKTMEAHDLLISFNVMDDGGIVTEFQADFGTGDPKPLVTNRDQALKKVSDLLDEGKTLLAAGGGSFPFPLSAGFAGFNTPATFLTYNRALKARAEAYRGSFAGAGGTANYTAALAALTESFIDPAGALTTGPAHTFSNASGDLTNPLFDPGPRIIHAHPATLAEAQSNGGTLDLRATSKVAPLPAPKLVNGITVDSKFIMYPSPSSPLPLIRNEELILLRSEARWFTGDRANATADLNLVRTQSGGLVAIAQPADDDAFITALLYERRYSLLFEGGHRWIDNRRFGRLATLPKALPAHRIFSRLLLPDNECVARTPQPAGCTQPPPSGGVN